MIGTMKYQEILEISAQLEQAKKDIEEVTTITGVKELTDFLSTVEGYSKYLVNTVELHQDADAVLKELNDKLK